MEAILWECPSLQTSFLNSYNPETNHHNPAETNHHNPKDSNFHESVFHHCDSRLFDNSQGHDRVQSNHEDFHSDDHVSREQHVEDVPHPQIVPAQTRAILAGDVVARSLSGVKVRKIDEVNGMLFFIL
jgi:hypothetical protein